MELRHSGSLFLILCNPLLSVNPQKNAVLYLLTIKWFY